MMSTMMSIGIGATIDADAADDDTFSLEISCCPHVAHNCTCSASFQNQKSVFALGSAARAHQVCPSHAFHRKRQRFVCRRHFSSARILHNSESRDVGINYSAAGC